jgi:hypothetical protein
MGVQVVVTLVVTAMVGGEGRLGGDGGFSYTILAKRCI